MSLIYFKRCDSCGGISDAASVPNPPGWHCLADNMHGTLATVDLCPGCLETTGLGKMLIKTVRARAVGALKSLLPEELGDVREALGYEQIVAAIEAGDYDATFERGDGIDLTAEAERVHALEKAEIEEAEVVG